MTFMTMLYSCKHMGCVFKWILKRGSFALVSIDSPKRAHHICICVCGCVCVCSFNMRETKKRILAVRLPRLPRPSLRIPPPPSHEHGSSIYLPTIPMLVGGYVLLCTCESQCACTPPSLLTLPIPVQLAAKMGSAWSNSPPAKSTLVYG